MTDRTQPAVHINQTRQQNSVPCSQRNADVRLPLNFQAGSNEVRITARLEGKASPTWISLKVLGQSSTSNKSLHVYYAKISKPNVEAAEKSTLEASGYKPDSQSMDTFIFRIERAA